MTLPPVILVPGHNPIYCLVYNIEKLAGCGLRK
jgi:hypothetical protein